MNSAAKAVFLDRDGVINQKPPEGLYVESPAEFVLLPGAAAAVARLSRNGYLVFVVTNQRCIARGMVPPSEVAAIHEQMCTAIRDAGGSIERVYVCPHDYSDACDCRKPKPGMLHQAALDFSLVLANCWMVGDSDSDIVAGHEAGCRTVSVGHVGGAQPDLIVGNLSEAVEQILSHTEF